MARPKGSLNKFTASAKDALQQAFEKRGGVASLIKWAKDNETDFYKLWGRLIPTEVSGPDGKPIPVTMVWKFGDKEVKF